MSAAPDNNQASAYRHRLATRTDLDAIVAIYNSTVASREVTADTEPVSVADRMAWFDAHHAARRPLWIAHRSQDSDTAEPVGWLSFSDFYGRPAYAGTAELSIYIREDQRGQGLGRYLMQAALAHAPGLQVQSLLGFIFGHNVASLALFERFGFARWGELPRVATLDGVERDLVIVGRRVV